MSGGGMGNVDPRVQRNPSTASPFGGSMATARPEPINYKESQLGQPYMGVGIQPMQPYGQPTQMPYGQPSRIEPAYGMPKPMHGMAVPPHTHGENGEIQMGGVQGHTEGRPYRGPDQQFTSLGSAVTAFYK